MARNLRVHQELSAILMAVFLALQPIVNGSAFVFAQDDRKARLFRKTFELLYQAKAEQADRLSPERFAKANASYESASREYDRGKNIQTKIETINRLLEAAIENANRARATYPHLISAREDALQAKAVEYAPDRFAQAEGLFHDTARTLERGDIDKAKAKSLIAEKCYREAELLAIKMSIIGNVKQSLQQAEDNDVHQYSPISFGRAKALLAESEQILNSDRSAKFEARQKAELAAYEVNHAAFLANGIKLLKKDDANWEKLLLQNEKYLSQVMVLLGLAPKFDQGFDRPVAEAIEAIHNLNQEQQRLANEIASQDQTIESLQTELIKLKAELDKSKEQEAGLKAKLALEQQQKERYRKAETIFSLDQAKILREGDQIRIRLIGLKFPSGKATIHPNYFGILTKLQRIIKLFPDYHVTIEGHTDNSGDDQANQLLSLNRARAVKSYLVANMGLVDSQIAAVGYGEGQPIASNEHDLGRSQNRRIDVILSPGQ